MPPTPGEASAHSVLRHGGARRQLLAVLIGVLPLYSGLILFQLRPDEPISLRGFTLYLAVISPLSLLIAFLSLRYLCGENPRALNLRPGGAASDLRHALVLSVVIIVANVLSTQLLSGLLPDAPSKTAVRNLFAELAGDPGLLVLFLALLIPLGAASEEVIRAFLLSRLWKVWPSTVAKLFAAAVSACLFGLVHLYQGPVGVSWTAIFGLIMAVYYLRFGRPVPLILAHYLTNALQVAVFAMAGV
jgi:membrane protease YdiL (CAAX protease family)